MNGTSKQAFDFGHISPIKYFFTVAFLLGVLFAFISQGDDPDRLFFVTFLQWQLQTGLPIALLIISHIFLSRFNQFETLNPWLQLIISGMLGVLIFSPIALMLDYVFGLNQLTEGQWGSEFLDELTGVGPPVIISWLAMNAPWILGYRIKQIKSPNGSQRSDVALNSMEEPKLKGVPLFDMLPSGIGKDVVFLKAELHYIEVNTTQGQALVLYNLKDAMRELKDLPGIQTHRSYWVNLQHLKQFKKQGRQGVLVMNDDFEVPISRAQLQAVNQACKSWLEKLN